MESKKILPLILENYKGCLLGRLKLLLMQEITQSDEIHPTEEEIRRYVFEHIKRNFPVGDMYVSIFNIKHYHQVKFSEFNAHIDIDSLIEDLQNFAIPIRNFIEISNTPILSAHKELGVIVNRESAKDGGCFYEIALVSDDFFPYEFAGFSTLCITPEERSISTLGSDGSWKTIHLNEVSKESISSFHYTNLYPILSLILLAGSRKPVLMNRDKIKVNENRKSNEKLMNLLSSGFNNEIPLVRMKVDFDKI